MSHGCHNHSGPSSEVKAGAVVLDEKSSIAQEPCHGGGLRSANLDENRPPGRHKPGRPGRDAAIGLKPIGTAVQGKIRIVMRHFRREPLDLAAGDVRRVGDDEVEFAMDRIEPI